MGSRWRIEVTYRSIKGLTQSDMRGLSKIEALHTIQRLQSAETVVKFELFETPLDRWHKPLKEKCVQRGGNGVAFNDDIPF